jgi:succinate-semialdehyde dehydrogenase/glutarate-semialdehyde dehydrogenase
MRSINPTTGETIREWKQASDDQVVAALKAAQSVFEDWSRSGFQTRGDVMRSVAAVLRRDKPSLARLMADEMGKPLAQGEAEVEKCAWACEYYARNAERFLADEPVPFDEGWEAAVVFRPLGCVLAVMPWNFPLWQVFRFAAPALMAGNTAVLKHASNVCGCATEIERVFREAGAPDGVFQTLLIGSDRVEGVIADLIVQAVTLTGSTPAGSAVASAAGKYLKKTVLELGGSDPYVVLADCDFERTVETCVTSRLINSGQSCIAAKRFIVEKPLYSAFVDAFTELMSRKRFGDPTEDGIDLGPLARADLRDELHAQVLRSVQRGARVTTGGEVPQATGAFYPPTVLAGVTPGMPAFDEETFGPVAAIVEANDAEEAIQLANASPFGLGAAVFTSDLGVGKRIASDRLNAGCCFVNDFVRSDPRLPFGGIKQSGYGRELSEFGIREFVNIKSVAWRNG